MSYQFTNPTAFNPSASVTDEFMNVYGNLMKMKAQQDALQMQDEELTWRKQMAEQEQARQRMIDDMEQKKFNILNEDRQMGIDAAKETQRAKSWYSTNRSLLRSGNPEDVVKAKASAEESGVNLGYILDDLQEDDKEYEKQKNEAWKRGLEVEKLNLKAAELELKRDLQKIRAGKAGEDIYQKYVKPNLSGRVNTFLQHKAAYKDAGKTMSYSDASKRDELATEIHVRNSRQVLSGRKDIRNLTELMRISSQHPEDFYLVDDTGDPVTLTQVVQNYAATPQTWKNLKENPEEIWGKNIPAKLKSKISESNSLEELVGKLDKKEALSFSGKGWAYLKKERDSFERKLRENFGIPPSNAQNIARNLFKLSFLEPFRSVPKMVNALEKQRAEEYEQRYGYKSGFRGSGL